MRKRTINIICFFAGMLVMFLVKLSFESPIQSAEYNDDNQKITNYMNDDEQVTLFYSDDIHLQYNIDDPNGKVISINVDDALALQIGDSVLNSIDYMSYEALVYPDDERTETYVYDTNKDFYIVLRGRSDYLDGESGVVVSKHDGRIIRVWVSA